MTGGVRRLRQPAGGVGWLDMCVFKATAPACRVRTVRVAEARRLRAATLCSAGDGGQAWPLVNGKGRWKAKALACIVVCRVPSSCWPASSCGCSTWGASREHTVAPRVRAHAGVVTASATQLCDGAACPRVMAVHRQLQGSRFGAHGAW
jgi:hypothetical protein